MPADFLDDPKPQEVALPLSWICPITGLNVPKRQMENLAWRRAMLEASNNDPEFQAALYSACSRSFLFWINAFCFTIREFTIEDGQQVQAVNKEIPFTTWPFQDEALLELQEAVERGDSRLLEKCRDMGATWMVIALFTHRFLFRHRQTFLVVSRKEEMVDVLGGQTANYPFGNIGAESTLMGKVDYILSRLPGWMLPKKMSRKLLHLVNNDNSSRIDGESANATAGSGDRRTAILLDEFAKIEEAESIKRSTKDVTACRIVVSTPNGPGTTFSKWALSGTIKLITLNWWKHPEKSKGIYSKLESNSRWKIRSPWYDSEESTRSPKEMAIEIDIDHIGSGEVYFEAAIIADHKRKFCKPPRSSYTVKFSDKLTDEAIRRAISSLLIDTIKVTPGGPLRVWVHLIDKRLDQSKTYTLGVDISKGQGASNSVVSVVCNETGEKVAEWADANTPPYEFAKVVCALGLWVGGRDRRPLVIYENNGDPGYDFGRQFVQVYRYANVYFDKRTGTLLEKAGKRYGWRSNTEKKSQMLGMLRRAYAHGKFINPSAESLTECLSYIQFPDGSIGPAALLEESKGARLCHGDRVIADGLCVWGIQDSPQFRDTKREANNQRTFAGRLAEWRSRKQHEQNQSGPKYSWEALTQ